MLELFEAIFSHYQSDPLSRHLKGFYHTEAPQEAEFPYGVFSLVSNVQDFTYTEDFENCLVQFNLYSDDSSPRQACELYELLKGDPVEGTGFDFLELSIEEYRTVSLMRENAILTRVEGVWQYNVTYRMVLQKTGEAAHFVSNKYMYNLLSI